MNDLTKGTKRLIVGAVIFVFLIIAGMMTYLSLGWANSISDRRDQTVRAEHAEDQSNQIQTQYNKLYKEFIKSTGKSPVAPSPSEVETDSAPSPQSGRNGIDGEDGNGVTSVACEPSNTWMFFYTQLSPQTVDAPCSAVNGKDGSQGTPGVNGADSTVPGPPGPQGEQGAPGTNGLNGTDGTNGADGATGLGISGIECTDDPNDPAGSYWDFTMTDGSHQTVEGPCHSNVIGLPVNPNNAQK